MRERFKAWKDQLTNGASDRSIAAHMGTNPDRVRRHLSLEDPPVAETVVAFARAYHGNPVAGLIAAGHLTADEVDAAASNTLDALQQATDTQLATEQLRRAAAREADQRRQSERFEVTRRMLE